MQWRKYRFSPPREFGIYQDTPVSFPIQLRRCLVTLRSSCKGRLSGPCLLTNPLPINSASSIDRASIVRDPVKPAAGTDGCWKRENRNLCQRDYKTEVIGKPRSIFIGLLLYQIDGLDRGKKIRPHPHIIDTLVRCVGLKRIS